MSAKETDLVVRVDADTTNFREDLERLGNELAEEFRKLGLLPEVVFAPKPWYRRVWEYLNAERLSWLEFVLLSIAAAAVRNLVGLG